MRENQFQRDLIRTIQDIYPDCMILKNDPTYVQGIPDLIILYENKWAMLECKRSITASIRPNQEYYISKLNDMSFAAFVCPENVGEILDELREFFMA